MSLFDPRSSTKSARHRKAYAQFEIWYTAVDFAAAGTFIFGSILFFSKSTQTAGTWLFLIGSILFALKPTIRLVRELRYYQLGKIDTLAKRVE